jgi:2-phosphosulfolactate phosphatase
MSVNVHNLPRHVAEQDLARSTVVVIDVLRATSTICQALAAGAVEVVPFREIPETLAAAASVGRHQVVLGGERHGTRIDGFDLGNSPSEYTPTTVGGRRVLFTTTNGTRAMHHARTAGRVLLASFLNLSAAVASIEKAPRIDIVCAGTGGQETLEDILAAGAIVDKLLTSTSASCQLNDAATRAAREWRLLVGKAELTGRPIREQLAIKLRETLGGRNLVQAGLERDLDDCAAIDTFSIVPVLDVPNLRIIAP